MLLVPYCRPETDKNSSTGSDDIMELLPLESRAVEAGRKMV